MKPRRKPCKANKLGTGRKQTVAEAAEVLSLHPETVREFIREGCPASKQGNSFRVDAPEVAAWMKSTGHTGKQGRPSQSDSPDLEAARLRKENALAAKYELQTARERGQLVEVEALQQWLIRNLTTTKNYMLGIPAKAVVLMVGRNTAEQHSILETLIREALETTANLADDLQNRPDAI